MARGFPAAILAGIVIATVIAFLVPGDVAQLPAEPLAGPDFSLVGQFSFGFFAKLGLLTAVLSVISFMLSDFFDTMGTLIGVGSEAGYLNDKGELVDAQRPLLVDSLGAVAGGARQRVVGDHLHRVCRRRRGWGPYRTRLGGDRGAFPARPPLCLSRRSDPGGGDRSGADRGRRA